MRKQKAGASLLSTMALVALALPLVLMLMSASAPTAETSTDLGWWNVSWREVGKGGKSE